MPQARSAASCVPEHDSPRQVFNRIIQSLESITGQATGYQQTGSITLALNGEREAELRRQATMANAFDVVCEWVEPDFIANQWPGITLSDARGGFTCLEMVRRIQSIPRLRWRKGQGRKAHSSSRTVRSPSWSSLAAP